MTERSAGKEGAQSGGEGPLDREAFAARVDDLMDRLYGTALRLTRNRDDAEDIVAEAIGTAWKRRADLRDAERFEGWLFRILNNTFVSWLRRRRSREDREISSDTDDDNADSGGEFSLFARLHQPFLLWWGTPEDEFLNRLLREDIQNALDQLPDDFRIAVILVEAQGHTYREVADMLDIPVGTVRSRLSRARSLLQCALWEQAQEAGIRNVVDCPDGNPDRNPDNDRS
jgi:RNA polymerase sigma factor (sigma-70 family)